LGKETNQGGFMNSEIFKEVAKQCDIYPFLKPMDIKPVKGVGRYCRLQPTAIYYELAYYNSPDMISIELHIEKNNMGKKDYEKKKEKVELLQKSLKYAIVAQTLPISLSSRIGKANKTEEEHKPRRSYVRF
jgi:hypothetical protein